MARVKYVEREELDSEGQGAYDGIAGSRGAVNNNFQALLNSPAAAARMADFGAYIRFETPLSARIRSLAVLTMTRETDGEYVWTVNERGALESGLEPTDIDKVRNRQAPEGMADADAKIVRFTQEYVRQHKISDGTYQAVQQMIGDAGMVDLLLTIGYYSSLSHALAAMEVDLPPGTPSTLPS